MSPHILHFNATLKQLTDCLERMCSGSRFHSDGAATANERAPNFDRFCPSDRLTVRLSQFGIMPKRFHLRSCGLHWRI